MKILLEDKEKGFTLTQADNGGVLYIICYCPPHGGSAAYWLRYAHICGRCMRPLPENYLALRDFANM